MQLTPHLHQLTIPFTVPTPWGALPRTVNVYLLVGRRITLIDSGVAGSETQIVAYLHRLGRRPEEIEQLLLTHSHPDHIGAAAAVVALSGCRVAAHGAEKSWIEDPARQAQERPVPGFAALVQGSVTIDRLLSDGEELEIEGAPALTVLHTPGHSAGSISLLAKTEGWLVSGDAVPVAGDLPIFDDYRASVSSLQRLQTCRADLLLSAWQPEMRGDGVRACLEAGERWLRRIQTLATEHAVRVGEADPLALCRNLVPLLGLPPGAVNPLVARTFAACVATG